MDNFRVMGNHIAVFSASIAYSVISYLVKEDEIS